MAFCTKCGAQNADGSAHCTTCGAPMGAPGAAASAAPPAAPGYAPPAAPQYAAPQAPQYAPPGAPVMYQGQSVPVQPGFLSVMWKSLDLGAKIAGVGGLVATIAFFLPLIGYSSYEGIVGETYNGLKLAGGSDGNPGEAAYWFRLILAIVAVGLLYFYYNNDLRTKIIVATAHCAIGTIWGFQVLRYLTDADSMKAYQFGWYAMTFGLLAVAVGGFMSILDLTKRLTGVR